MALSVQCRVPFTMGVSVLGGGHKACPHPVPFSVNEREEQVKVKLVAGEYSKLELCTSQCESILTFSWKVEFFLQVNIVTRLCGPSYFYVIRSLLTWAKGITWGNPLTLGALLVFYFNKENNVLSVLKSASLTAVLSQVKCCSNRSLIFLLTGFLFPIVRLLANFLATCVWQL